MGRKLNVAWLETPLGELTVISNANKLILLWFISKQDAIRNIARMESQFDATVVQGMSSPIRTIDAELRSYFKGTLKTFTTPVQLLGTPFQKRVWKELCNIPYGETLSYSDIASKIGRPTACRGVAKAIASNLLTIVVPCHRVICKDGELGGYSGGIERKKWLLEREAIS